MQKAKLKTVVWWVIGTVATVPLTKLVEGSFDVSLFSPYITRLWDWIQSGWSWLGSDVSLPAWLMLLLSIMSVLLLVFVGVLVYANRYEKGDEVPEGAPLTDEQQKVFVILGKAYQEGHHLGFEEILQYSGLSRIAAQRTLDHLCNVGLIRPVRSRYGSQHADLTPLGQDHYLELEREYGWGAMR